MKIDFHDHLQDIFWKENPMTLDDMFPDSFNEWLEEQDIEQIADWANDWCKKMIK